ncbi:YncE family protein [Alkaliphilus hydrothermalis]|uniref:YVTN family beta-propeller protein n=1 Tax=Alkaliphilus hydrothermalis TaxID=1482730 RepID=A0ABS2NTL8_9FIRM|nr:beta-propeller fold lactonase family protein [Alkaliphilus hydrothermalis]MBM7616324.1 YVTN family beta-propeller protein [Alkaliphilus hydrothermalis]
MNYLSQGNLIVSNFSDDSISIVDVTIGKEVRRISLKTIGKFIPSQPLGPHHIALDSNLKYLYVVNSFDNSLSKIDLIKEEIINTVMVGSCPSQVILCKKYGCIYVANSDSNSITVLDLNELSIQLQIPTDEMPHGMAMTKDQERIFVANREEKTLTEICTSLNEKKETHRVACNPWHLRLSGDGDLLFVVNYSHQEGEQGKVEIYDIHGMELVDEITLGKMPVEVASDWGNEHLYVTDSDLDQLYVYSLKEKRLLKSIKLNKMPHGIEIDYNKNLLFVSSIQNNVIDIVSCRSKRVIRSIEVGKEPTSVVII